MFPHAVDTTEFAYRMFREHHAITDTAVRIVDVSGPPPDEGLWHQVSDDTFTTRTVGQLLEFMQTHGFEPRIVKVDLEDVSIEGRVLSELLGSDLRPGLIIVESGDRERHLAALLAMLGYEQVLESGYNRYYFAADSLG